MEAQLGTDRERLAALQNQVSTLGRDIPEHLRADGAIVAAVSKAEADLHTLNKSFTDAQTAHIEAVGAHTAAVTKQGACTQQLSAAQGYLQDAVAELTKRIEEAGFADEHALRAAQRSPDQRRALDVRIRRWEQDRAAAIDRVQRTKTEAEGLKPPDMVALELAYTEASEAANT